MHLDLNRVSALPPTPSPETRTDNRDPHEPPERRDRRQDQRRRDGRGGGRRRDDPPVGSDHVRGASPEDPAPGEQDEQPLATVIAAEQLLMLGRLGGNERSPAAQRDAYPSDD